MCDREDGRCGSDVPDEKAAFPANFIEPDCEVVRVDIAECERVAGARVSHWESYGRPRRENIVSIGKLGRLQPE